MTFILIKYAIDIITSGINMNKVLNENEIINKYPQSKDLFRRFLNLSNCFSATNELILGSKTPVNAE